MIHQDRLLTKITGCANIKLQVRTCERRVGPAYIFWSHSRYIALPFKKPYNGVMDLLNTSSNRPNLSKAIEVALRELENLKHEGLITRYDQEAFEEEGIYHLTAYTRYPEKVDRELGHLSASISIEFDLPFYILVSKENGEK
jgi:hypothetical protein